MRGDYLETQHFLTCGTSVVPQEPLGNTFEDEKLTPKPYGAWYTAMWCRTWRKTAPDGTTRRSRRVQGITRRDAIDSVLSD